MPRLAKNKPAWEVGLQGAVKEATEMQKEMLIREQNSLRSQMSKNEAKHQLEMQMMKEQIQKLKKEI